MGDEKSQKTVKRYYNADVVFPDDAPFGTRARGGARRIAAGYPAPPAQA